MGTENTQANEPTTTAVATSEMGMLNYMDGSSLNKAYKNAQIIATSSLMPDTYAKHPENVLIAMDIASRTNYGLMMVMQNLYIVKGHPAWSGQFCLAAIKGCGKYSNVKYVWVGDNKDAPDYGCYLQATEVATGETVRGSVITNAMVKGEGWLQKAGSKWQTMPEQMFKYRAAAFFARTECPEVLMGLQTVEEINDVAGYEPREKKTTTITLDGTYEEVN